MTIGLMVGGFTIMLWSRDLLHMSGTTAGTFLVLNLLGIYLVLGGLITTLLTSRKIKSRYYEKINVSISELVSDIRDYKNMSVLETVKGDAYQLTKEQADNIKAKLKNNGQVDKTIYYDKNKKVLNSYYDIYGG